jgi:Flp pilus assembly protein TadD
MFFIFPVARFFDRPWSGISEMRGKGSLEIWLHGTMYEWTKCKTVVGMSDQKAVTEGQHLTRWIVWGGLLTLLYAFAVYPALRIPFLLDDHSKIVLNPDIRSLQGLWSKLIYPYGPAPVSTRNDPSRPLVYLVYTLLYTHWGPDPLFFHLVNLTTHWINFCLFVILLRQILLALGAEREVAPLALLGGGFFLLTTINIGTVAYIYGLSDVLSLTGVLGAMVCHGLGGRYPKWASLGIFLSTVFALSAKQIAVLLPLILVLYDGLVNPKVFSRGFVRLVSRYAPSLMPVLLYLMGRYLYFGQMGDLEGTSHVKPLGFYILAQAHGILHYVGASFIPIGLCLDHDLPYPPSHAARHLAKTLFLLSLTFVSSVLLWRRRSSPRARLLLFGLFFTLLWLAPTSSIIPTVDYVVERRIYGGTLGLAAMWLAGIWTVRDFLKGRLLATIAAWVLLLVYGGVFAAISQQRLKGMQEEKSVWLEVLRRYPLSYRALGNLANAYIAEKNFAEALGYYQKILILLPDHATTYTNIAFVYAAVSSPLRDLEKAKFYLQRALELDPKIAEAWQNLGLVTMEQGEVAEAERYFRRATEVDPRHVGAYNQLCALMLDQRRYDEARAYFDIARSLVPDHPMVIENGRRLSEGP